MITDTCACGKEKAKRDSVCPQCLSKQPKVMSLEQRIAVLESKTQALEKQNQILLDNVALLESMVLACQEGLLNHLKEK